MPKNYLLEYWYLVFLIAPLILVVSIRYLMKKYYDEDRNPVMSFLTGIGILFSFLTICSTFFSIFTKGIGMGESYLGTFLAMAIALGITIPFALKKWSDNESLFSKLFISGILFAIIFFGILKKAIYHRGHRGKLR